MSRRTAGLIGAAGLIAVLTLAARVAGFGRTLVFADTVRAAGVGEVYNAVNAVPNVLYEVVAGGALAAIAVPLIGRHLGRDDRERADRTASVLLTWVLVLLVPLAVLVWLLAEPVAQWLVGDRVTGGVTVGAAMLRIFAWQIPFYGAGAVLGGLLQSHRRFGAVALAPLLSSLVVIGTYVAYGRRVDGRTQDVGADAIALLAWGTTAGVLALSLPLIVPALRLGWRWRPTLRFEEGDGRRAGSLASAGLIGLAGQQVATIATIWVSNHRGGEGTLSVYTWVQAVYLLPYAVLAVPLATAAFPAMATAQATPDLALTLRRVLYAGALGTLVLSGAAGSIGAFFALLDRTGSSGTASGSAVGEIGAAIVAFSPGLVGFAAAALLVRACYVRGSAVAAGTWVAVGWLVAGLTPVLLVPADASPRQVLLTLGWCFSAGMTVAAIGLAVVAVRGWGAGAWAGAGRSLAAVGLAVTLWLAGSWRLGGSAVPSFVDTGSWVSIVLGGVGAAVVALLPLLGGYALLDRRTLRARAAR